MYCYVLVCIFMDCYGLLWNAMYCFVLLCIVVYCDVLLCIVCIVMYLCSVLSCYVSLCIVMYLHVLLRFVMFFIVMLWYVLLCIVMWCYVLLCSFMLCIVMLCCVCMDVCIYAIYGYRVSSLRLPAILQISQTWDEKTTIPMAQNEKRLALLHNNNFKALKSWLSQKMLRNASLRSCHSEQCSNFSGSLLAPVPSFEMGNMEWF